MQEYGAAAPGNARAGVVVDFDNEIVEVIVALQAVAGLACRTPHRLVVVTVGRIFAPGIVSADRPARQMGPGADMAVGPPPQSLRTKDAARGAAIALALVGHDAATAERDGDGPTVGREPTPTGISGSAVNADQREWPITHRCLISD